MKLSVLLYTICFISFHSIFSQNPSEVSNLEALADSIYFNKSEYYTEKDYKRLQKIRKQITSSYLDTTQTKYHVAKLKEIAADALVSQFHSDFPLAITQSNQALALFEKHHIKDLYFKGHIHKYLFEQYFYNKNWEKSLKEAQRAKKVFGDTLAPNHRLLAEAEFNIGFALGKFGDYSKVIERYKNAIELNVSNQGEMNADVAIQKHHLAIVYGFVGYYKKELDTYLEVVNIWENISYHDKSFLNIAYGSLNTWYLQHGDYDTAEKYLIKSENLINNKETNIDNWSNEVFKGRTQLELWRYYAKLNLKKGDTLNAFAYNKKAMDFIDNYRINDPENNPHNVPYYKHFLLLNKMGLLRFEASILKEKDANRAIKIYEQVLSLESEDEVPVFTLSDKLNLIQLYINNENYAQVKTRIKHWVESAKEKKDPYLLMQLYAQEANLEAHLGSFESMDAFYKTAFKYLPKDPLEDIEIKDLTYLNSKPYSHLHYINLLLDASRNYELAYRETHKKLYLEIAHNLSKMVSDIFSKNYVFTSFNDKVYAIAIQINEQLLQTSLLIDNERILDGVLEKIEESNSKISWKRFLNSSERKNINIPEVVLNKESDLKNALHFYKKQLFISDNEGLENQKTLKSKIFDTEKEIDSLNRWYKENYFSYFNQTQNKFQISDLKSKLQSDQKIIKYCFTQNHIFVFTITKDVTQLHQLADTNELNEFLNEFVHSLKEPNTDAYKTLAKQAYRKLLPNSVLDISSHTNLIFILDDVLHYLPFESIIDGDNKYLVESKCISYASSLLLFNEQINSIKSKQNSLGIYAPTYNSSFQLEENKDKTAQLKGASLEAIQIGELFGADVFLGEDANKEVFLKTAKNYSTLHLAMHAEINKSNPEFSHLSFSSSGDDSKLFLSELYNISLNADLAVLSACETGAGKLKKGEGLVNVSQAFTYAGVSSLVTSLWKVPDKETAQIMLYFYTYLEKGFPKNKALQLAKLDYLKNEDDVLLKHPFYWAGFVISGDVTPIKTKTNWYWFWFIVPVVGLVLFRKKLFQFFK